MWQNNRYGHWEILLVMVQPHETRCSSNIQPRFYWKFCKKINRYDCFLMNFICAFPTLPSNHHFHLFQNKKQQHQLSFLRNIVWLMSNLCRNKNPAPPLEKVMLMLPALSEFLRSEDTQILSKPVSLIYFDLSNSIKIFMSFISFVFWSSWRCMGNQLHYRWGWWADSRRHR